MMAKIYQYMVWRLMSMCIIRNKAAADHDRAVLLPRRSEGWAVLKLERLTQHDIFPDKDSFYLRQTYTNGGLSPNDPRVWMHVRNCNLRIAISRVPRRQDCRGFRLNPPSAAGEYLLPH
jgi:hypothetical protein